MPYFVGLTALSTNIAINGKWYAGEGLDWADFPPEALPKHIITDYLGDPVGSSDPALAQIRRPIEVKFSKRRRADLPDLVEAGLKCNGDLLISDKVKRVIEAIEPGIHYFFRFNFIHPDGTFWHQPYWIFVPGRPAERQVLIVEQSPGLKWVPSKWHRFPRRMRCYRDHLDMGAVTMWTPDRAKGFVIDKDMVGTSHIVAETTLRSDHIFFLSDTLVAALRAAGVRGFKFVRVKAEERRVPPYGATSGSGAVE